ncbi:DUF4998 domain-containing protein [Niabella sp.]|uniref:DUF4998 domain-containing protein n=1 Tax=Niabella sp. TaxID=1962976 RepID=UPI00262489A2|nr:DUF4998 domain-containing protein [Niabella sp.]
MRGTYLLLGIVFIMAAIHACNKPTEYRKYLGDDEINYPGAPQNVVIQPQYHQVTFRFNPSPDPRVTAYVVYWNNKADSMRFPATSNDPASFVKLTIPNIPDYMINNFTIQSVYSNGTYSKVVYLSNVRSIGDVYLAGLNNRPVTGVAPATKVSTKIPMDSVYLAFKGIVDTVNAKTEIYWTDLSGNAKTTEIDNKNAKVLLPGFKINTWVYYLSFYKPNRFTDEMYTPVRGKDSVKIVQAPNGSLSLSLQ